MRNVLADLGNNRIGTALVNQASVILTIIHAPPSDDTRSVTLVSEESVRKLGAWCAEVLAALKDEDLPF